MRYTHYYIDESHIIHRSLYLRKADGQIKVLEYDLFEGRLEFIESKKKAQDPAKWLKYNYPAVKDYMIAQLQSAINDLANKELRI